MVKTSAGKGFIGEWGRMVGEEEMGCSCWKKGRLEEWRIGRMEELEWITCLNSKQFHQLPRASARGLEKKKNGS